MATREEQLNNAVYNTALAAATAEKPVYAGTYEGQLNDQFDRIQNREKFSYDVNEDPLYQSYKDQYIQNGKLAMKDTMGQAAALTGGYGSTYGQQVGQQTYDAYLQNLSAVIPQLYGMAYGRYQDEGDNLKDLYGLVGQRRDNEYGEYRDRMGDWEYGQQLAAAREAEAYNRRIAEDKTAYERELDAYNQRIAEENTAWERQQQAYANLRALILQSGYTPDDDELAAAGMTRAAASALRAEYNRSITPTVTSSGNGRSGGGGNYGSGGGGGGSGTWVTSNPNSALYQAAEDLAYAVNNGADAWSTNTAILQNPNLTSTEKRSLISVNPAPVNYDKNTNHYYEDQNAENNAWAYSSTAKTAAEMAAAQQRAKENAARNNTATTKTTTVTSNATSLLDKIKSLFK